MGRAAFGRAGAFAAMSTVDSSYVKDVARKSGKQFLLFFFFAAQGKA